MNQESGKNPLKKLDMEQFIEDHSRDMMDGQEKMTAGGFVAQTPRQQVILRHE